MMISNSWEQILDTNHITQTLIISPTSHAPHWWWQIKSSYLNHCCRYCTSLDIIIYQGIEKCKDDQFEIWNGMKFTGMLL